MKKAVKRKTVSKTLTLPWRTLSVGPGTVPTSSASLTKTSVKDMVSGLRKASRIGLFESALKIK